MVEDEAQKRFQTVVEDLKKDKDLFVFVIAVTNYPDKVGLALKKRFGTSRHFGQPTEENRLDIFKYYIEKKIKDAKLEKSKNAEEYQKEVQELAKNAAKQTKDFSVREIGDIVKDANSIRALTERKQFSQDHFNQAIQRFKEEQKELKKYKVEPEVVTEAEQAVEGKKEE